MFGFSHSCGQTDGTLDVEAENVEEVPSEDLTESREQVIPPPAELCSSSRWLTSIHHYNELEGPMHDSTDTLVTWGSLATSSLNDSQHSSIELRGGAGSVRGPPESPLKFDHEELLRIDPDVCSGDMKTDHLAESRQLSSLPNSALSAYVNRTNMLQPVFKIVRMIS